MYQRLFSSSNASLGLVDLRSLFTIQPHVNFTYAEQSFSREPTVQEVLEKCLPTTPKSTELWGGVTHRQGEDLACTLCTTDLNFVVSEAKLDTNNGTHLSFTFNRVSVFCQVVEVNGCLYLKDGTHRAVGLLARGITKMPCVVVRGARESQVPDHLPPDVLFGPTRPLIADFLDPDLHFAHEWAERVKVIRIRVDEFVMPHRPT
ncbi:MAG: hypothetical protein IRZ18_03865 [Clostridia bacterium]|nr:hypothetical protein [Clostridia bacterium]